MTAENLLMQKNKLIFRGDENVNLAEIKRQRQKKQRKKQKPKQRS